MVGEFPKGGKYCGYRSNSFSDESIDKSGFLWWCRYWQPGAVEIHLSNPYETGVDQDPLTAYLPKFFGDNNVVDIPSTLNSAQYGSLSQNRSISAFKLTLNRILRPYFELQLRITRFFSKTFSDINSKTYLTCQRRHASLVA